MSEPTAQPKADSDFEAMAAALARRRKRLFTLNILILIVPLAAAIIFFLFGRDDRTWVREKVVETVGELVPPEVKQTVPPRVREALAESRVEERLAAVEAKLGLPASGGEASIPSEQEGTAVDVPTDTSVPQELLDRVKSLESLGPRLDEVEASLKNFEQPDGVRKVPALWTSLRGQGDRLDGQRASLDEHLQRIQALEELNDQLAQHNVIERLRKTEEDLQKLSTDLNTKVASIPGINQRLISLENQRREIGDMEQALKTLRSDIENKIAEEIKNLNTKWEAAQKNEQEEVARRFTSVGRRIDTVEKSAFRSTLTRERDTITIPSLNFLVRTEDFQDDDTLAKLTIQPPGEPPIPLPSPVRLDQPLSFKHKGCNFEVTVRRVTKVPGFRDYMEVLLGRQCPNPGTGN